MTKVEVDNKQFLQATVRDITERKKSEDALKERSKELEEINKIMVDREMRMVELKHRVEVLEKKLDSKSKPKP